LKSFVSSGERRAQLAFLDGLRGLAALYVAIGHARWLLWEGYAEGYKQHPERYSALGKALVYGLATFRWGHEAVIFFFVLSGFVIHLRYATKIAGGSSEPFDFWPYLGRRARRLYPPLLAALLLTFALDAAGARLHLPTASATTPYPLLNANLGNDHSIPTALRNLVFIMDPVFGTDGPLWSLNYEWYFYLLYPAVVPIARRSSIAATLALVGLSILGAAPIWPSSMRWLYQVFQMMIVWWFGALLADRFAGRLRVGYRQLSVLMLAPLGLAAGVTSAFFHDLIVGVGFTGLIAACFALQEAGWSLRPLGRLQPLGNMSYTLYVIHFPILVLLGGWLMKRSGGPLPGHFGWLLLGMSAVLIVAWLLHLVVERPFVRHPSSNRSNRSNRSPRPAP
jgi:peptidoglycan/LPS O-acetylase OafA/YrhL